jgi:hypothetical protein
LKQRQKSWTEQKSPWVRTVHETTKTSGHRREGVHVFNRVRVAVNGGKTKTAAVINVTAKKRNSSRLEKEK